jgi:ribosomal protein S18 acetylase RimI-like enzyme
MTTEPTFRQATKEDLAAVLAVGHRLWDEMAEHSGFTQRPTEEGIARLLAGEGHGAVFVCEIDGAVCGFSLLVPEVQEPGVAAMGAWLLPETRSKGIGRELALMATDHAREAGFTKLRGIIPRDNETALSFFSEIASLAQMVGHGMEYELPL